MCTYIHAYINMYIYIYYIGWPASPTGERAVAKDGDDSKGQVCKTTLFNKRTHSSKRTNSRKAGDDSKVQVQSCADNLTCREISKAEAGSLLGLFLDTNSPKEP